MREFAGWFNEVENWKGRTGEKEAEFVIRVEMKSLECNGKPKTCEVEDEGDTEREIREKMRYNVLIGVERLGRAINIK